MAALAEIADLIMGQSPPSSTYNDAGGGLAFFQGKTDFGFRHPTPKMYCNAPLKIAKPNDILMSVRAPVGPTNIADRECCIGRGLAAIRPRDIDGRFLFFNLRYIEKFIASLGSGSTFHAINKSQLASVEVNPLGFGLPEQRKIATVLGMVQRAIEQQERMLALTAELKKALLHKLFTEGLRGEPQKQTEIGPVPESWEIATIEDVANLRKEIADPAASAEEVYVGLEHIESSRFWCSRHGHPSKVRSAKNAFYHGDILYGKLRPYLDKAVIAASNGICSTDILVFTPKDGYKGEFIVSVLHTAKLIAFAIKTTSGVNHPRTSWNALKSYRFGLPQKNDRDDIARIMIKLETKILNSERKRRVLEDLFRTLLHQLMTAQLRVNERDLDILECGDVSPLSEGATRRADQSADPSAHSEKQSAVVPAHSKRGRA
ncbi:MAG: restriction endonuclease subunit S [bacterium]